MGLEEIDFGFGLISGGKIVFVQAHFFILPEQFDHVLDAATINSVLALAYFCLHGDLFVIFVIYKNGIID